MCRTCGCSDDSRATITDLASGASAPLQSQKQHFTHDHDHDHDGHDHGHHHDHDDGHVHAQMHAAGKAIASARHHGRMIWLEQELLAKNRLLAERNRGWLGGRNVVAINLISSPGAGKTTLLERSIRDLRDEWPISVIEGDQATLHDAQRIQATGCQVVQINTGAGCHLEAQMTARGLEGLDPPPHSLVMIENVGNLVCPALFDLGEHAKVVIMSVTEGEDKPAKYPHAFRASQVMILNKIDLLPYVHFNVERCLEFARQTNPRLRILQISATRGDGLSDWYAWLRDQRSVRPALRVTSLIEIP